MSDISVTSGYDGLRLPFSAEAEQSVLGAILLDSTCLDRVVEILPKAEYFHLANHKIIYGVILEMFALGQAVDFITVLEALKKDGSFDEATGKPYLLKLAEIVPSITNVENYAKIVRDNYDVRTLIITARDIIENASEGTSDAATLLDSAEQSIFDIRQGKNMQGLQKIDEIMVQTFDRLDALNSEDGSEFAAIPTGISDLFNFISCTSWYGKNKFCFKYSKKCCCERKKKSGIFFIGNDKGAVDIKTAVNGSANRRN